MNILHTYAGMLGIKIPPPLLHQGRRKASRHLSSKTTRSRKKASCPKPTPSRSYSSQPFTNHQDRLSSLLKAFTPPSESASASSAASSRRPRWFQSYRSTQKQPTQSPPYTSSKRSFYDELSQSQIRRAQTMYEKALQAKLLKEKETELARQKLAKSLARDFETIVPTGPWAHRTYLHQPEPIIPDRQNIRYHILAFWWKWTIRMAILYYIATFIFERNEDDEIPKTAWDLIYNTRYLIDQLVDNALYGFYKYMSRFYFFIRLRYSYLYHPDENKSLEQISSVMTECSGMEGVFTKELQLYLDYLAYHGLDNKLPEQLGDPLIAASIFRGTAPFLPTIEVVNFQESGIRGKLGVLHNNIFDRPRVTPTGIGKMLWGDNWNIVFPEFVQPGENDVDDTGVEDVTSTRQHPGWDQFFEKQPGYLKRVHNATLAHKKKMAIALEAERNNEVPWYDDIREVIGDGKYDYDYSGDDEDDEIYSFDSNSNRFPVDQYPVVNLDRLRSSKYDDDDNDGYNNGGDDYYYEYGDDDDDYDDEG